MASSPKLSIVVVIHEMEREAPRSLHSLSAKYQQGVSPEDYEVIVVDSGSRRPFNSGSVAEFGPNFSYHYLPEANRSPSRAMNLGVRLAQCDYLALMIDGARILTPGILRYGLMLPSLFTQPCGLVLGFHIGPDLQSRSIEKGYNQAREDELLRSIGWPENPYRLFEISSAHDPTDGWFRLVGESNFTFVHRHILERIGGYDERFVAVGGGLVNLDVQTAIYERPDVDLVMILGEGTFHQFHGGATSGRKWGDVVGLVGTFGVEYRRIRGRDFDASTERRPHYVGHVPEEAMEHLRRFVSAASPDLVQSQRHVHRLHHEVSARDRLIETLRQEQVEREKTVAALHREVARRDELIESLRAGLASQPRGMTRSTPVTLRKESDHASPAKPRATAVSSLEKPES